MKQKILDKLKANRTAESKDVTDITLEAQAELLANFILDDEALGKLDAAAAIKSMQGNINFTASAAARAEREKLSQPKPEEKAEEKGGGMTPEQIAEIIKAAQAPLLEKINSIEGGNAKAKLIEDAKLAISEKFRLEDSEVAGSEYIFNMISDRDFENTDAFVETYESEYNKFRAANGAGNVVLKSAEVVDTKQEEIDAWAKKIKEQRKAEAEKAEKANSRFNN